MLDNSMQKPLALLSQKSTTLPLRKSLHGMSSQVLQVIGFQPIVGLAHVHVLADIQTFAKMKRKMSEPKANQALLRLADLSAWES